MRWMAALRAALTSDWRRAHCHAFPSRNIWDRCCSKSRPYLIPLAQPRGCLAQRPRGILPAQAFHVFPARVAHANARNAASSSNRAMAAASPGQIVLGHQERRLPIDHRFHHAAGTERRRRFPVKRRFEKRDAESFHAPRQGPARLRVQRATSVHLRQRRVIQPTEKFAPHPARPARLRDFRPVRRLRPRRPSDRPPFRAARAGNRANARATSRCPLRGCRRATVSTRHVPSSCALEAAVGIWLVRERRRQRARRDNHLRSGRQQAALSCQLPPCNANTLRIPPPWRNTAAPATARPGCARTAALPSRRKPQASAAPTPLSTGRTRKRSSAHPRSSPPRVRSRSCRLRNCHQPRANRP